MQSIESESKEWMEVSETFVTCTFRDLGISFCGSEIARDRIHVTICAVRIGSGMLGDNS